MTREIISKFVSKSIFQAKFDKIPFDIRVVEKGGWARRGNSSEASVLSD
jgi:hypothetical protein